MKKPLPPPLSEQIIWLTGASSGIGAALVHGLSKRCQWLIISARNSDRLQQLAELHPNVVALSADVTSRDAMQAVAADIAARFGRIDTLIANAGSCEYLDVRQFDSALVKRVIDTNVYGLVNSLEAALPLIRNSQRGYLVAVSSSVTYLALPQAQAYGASKAAVRYFMEAMRADLASEHIDVSVVSPGFVKTPLTDRNRFRMPMRISANVAAEAIIKSLQRRPWDIHFPRRFTWLLQLLGCLPADLRLALTRRAATRLPTSPQKQPD